MRRSDRIALISKTLSENPNKVISLNYFAKRLGAAKSSISEDLDIIKNAFINAGEGEIVTIPGASGGVRYRTQRSKQDIQNFLQDFCKILQEEKRIIPGGYLYMTDAVFSPVYSRIIGEIFAQLFIDRNPTHVLTVETKGIPIAIMTARALNVPMVSARRDSRVTEGPSVSISYVSGSGQKIHNMSLAKRALPENAKVLIVDDFMKGGGTARGMMELAAEFKAEVIGTAMVVTTAVPKEKLVRDFTSLLILKRIDTNEGKIYININDKLL
ncbi:MAG: pur operon repressor [Tepidanaerobacter acetatoxydans]|jgi:purine operon repressor|uniref:pur operon repressor n=1 Tax=Tepidanaerobacter TaxID=499228 RepID=UPI000A9D8170|nr:MULTISPECIES: pur operon repressor [Tepidanaerobacter]NLU10311.1 pur operon repressor [Tepidanaerobacter acetatoxydans]